MKLKKLVALGMATTLVMAPMSVYATDATEPVKGSVESVEGDVNYVDTTIYKVTVPTSTGLSFALDPQGLTSLEEESGYDASAVGKVVGGDGTLAVNMSSVPIKVTAEFFVTDGNDKALTAATLKTGAASDLIDDDANDVILQIVPNGSTAPTADDAQDLSKFTGWSTTANDIKAITASTAAAADKVTFALAAADYKFAKKSVGSGYEYVADTASGKTTATYAAFKIAGTVSKDGDWSAFTKETSPETIKLNCIFSFEGLKEIEEDACSTTAAGLVTDDTKLKGFTTPATLSNGTLAVGESSVTLTFTPGTAAETLDATYVGNKTTNIKTWSKFSTWGCSINATTNKVVIGRETFSSLTAESDGTYAITVKDSTGATYTGYITVVTE